MTVKMHISVCLGMMIWGLELCSLTWTSRKLYESIFSVSLFHLPFLGSILGCFCIHRNLGRIKAMMVAAVCYLLGSLFHVGVYLNVGEGMYFTGRFIQSFAVGIISVFVPLYVSETSNTMYRQRKILFCFFCSFVGYFVGKIMFMFFYETVYYSENVTLVLGKQILQKSSHIYVHSLTCLKVLISLIWIASLFFTNESYRALIVQGKFEKAFRNLLFFHPEGQRMEIIGIVANAAEFAPFHIGSPGWLYLFKKQVLRNILVVCGMHMLNIWAFSSYSTRILESFFESLVRGHSWTDWLFFVIMVSLCTVLALIMSHQYKQRSLYIYCATQVCLCLSCIFLMDSLNKKETFYRLNLSLFPRKAFDFMFLVFATTAKLQPWIYQYEIFPLSIAPKCLAVTCSWYWLQELIYHSLINPCNDAYPRRLILAPLSAFGVAFLTFVGMKNTRNLALETMSLLFE